MAAPSLLALALTALSTAQDAPSVIAQDSWFEVGQRIPTLELPRVDGGGTVDLADLRGRKLLLIQFASW